MALVKEYFELTKKYQEEYGENTILLMQVGSFFEVYGKKTQDDFVFSGSKINDFSTICDLAIVDKNVCVGSTSVVMAGFKDFMIEKYLRKIQDAGFTAAVHTQDEAAKNTTRSCLGIFSPGTYFSNESTNLTNNITCIWINLIENKVLMKGKFVIVGIANIDIFTGKTSIFEFKEPYFNNPTTYDELERFISIYKPTEAIFISNFQDENELDYVISYSGIQCNVIHKINICVQKQKNTQKLLRAKNCEKQVYQKSILTKFYKIGDFDMFFQNFYNNNIATQAFCYLLDFVYQHNPNLVNKISEPIFENCSERLILANHSLKQLNIIDDNNYTGKYSSIIKMLNSCFTPMGKRKFAYQFLNPTTNIEYLQREYDITEYFLHKLLDSKFDNFIKSRMISIKDISKNERQIFLKKITPKQFYILYNNILLIRDIYNEIRNDSQIMSYIYFIEKNVYDIDSYCGKLIDFINSKIDLSIAKEIDQCQQFETNFFHRDIDEELDTQTEKLNDSTDKLESIRNHLSNLIENTEKKGKTKSKTNDYVKIHETEKNSIGLICTNRRCKLLDTSLPTIKSTCELTYKSSFYNEVRNFQFQFSKGQFDFVKQNINNSFIMDEQINELCKNITNVKISLKDVISRVYNNFIEGFENYQTMLESIINFITCIDVLYNKCIIAKKYNYCKPNIEQREKSFIDAKNLRHCLIEQLQTNEIYVANDITLGDGNVDGILLYGTNAVGKTSIIRALGISLIMAQSGLYVPCSSFTFSPYKYIFTRIIGNDNIFKGLSTFAVEMSELRTILKLADHNSLVLGDELCSGTENTSAVSIFVAGIQKLHELRSSFIFATHLHEIVDFEEISSLKTVALKHLEVTYDKSRDILIYDRKLKDGPGNSMYGLEVCKSLNLPNDFLEAAYNIREKYNPETRGILSLKTSHFNSQKIIGLCEKCGINMGSEVHHLQHQKLANDDGYIEKNNMLFHKNKLANLMTLCEKCHNDIHKEKKQYKKVKTTKGYILNEV